MKEPSPASVGTTKRKLLIDVGRLCAELRRISGERYYCAHQVELAEVARDVERAIERGVPGALRTGVEVRREHLRQALRFRRQIARASVGYSSTPAKVTRTRGQHVRTVLPRTRSREQPHAPRRAARSTPKAAQRSGDSGDSSDPPGPEPAALAALLLVCLHLRGLA